MSKNARPFTLAFLLALLLHVLVLLALIYAWQRIPKANLEEQLAKKIEVRLKDKQLVQITPPTKDFEPRKAEHKAEFNQRVEQETQSAHKSPQPKPRISTPPPKPSNPNKTGEIGKKLKVPDWRELMKAESRQPSDFNDRLDPSIQTGVHTQLNTFEWKHASYFNRIKESVSRAWSPVQEMKRFDPAGALLGERDRLTVLEVTINSKGELIHTRVADSSDVFYLDSAAIKSFEAASPFPHPPKSLFESKDLFQFRFGFYVEMGRSFSIGY